MKRLANLWPQVTSFDNLYRAYRLARRGKRNRPDIIAFSLDLEAQLLQLRALLLSGEYRPGRYRQFTVYERKLRVISAAPFVDRVVHHAVMGVVEAPLDRRFIFDSYAWRQGKGVHAAVNRYQRLAQRHAYVVQLDVRQYFASIDHCLLKAALARRIGDARVLQLLSLIIDASPPVMTHVGMFCGDDLLTCVERRHGIPVGNLTSQFFANLYLDDFDHWAKESLRVPGYLRYVDDLILLADDAYQLRDAVAQCHAFLERLRLRLHAGQTHIRRTSEKIPVLGYQVSRTRRWLRADNGYRFRRRLRAMAARYQRHQVSLVDVGKSVVAWTGHARHAEADKLVACILDGVLFQRDTEASAPAG
ncbi:MAG: RNA-directed DNA polymerase [Gammaproteobacteria bacterium]|nr:MAG: RNA-directed DNA polymerase [Gammaproteobacteria bacterium]